jgi:ferritin-like metal-binding protein YciE
MADDLNARDSKLVQYLNEAYGKEKELETALQAHIKMTGSRATYKKRLQDHLKETKAQAKGLERRIKQLGGKAEATNLPGPDVVSSVAGAATAAATKTVAAAKGPVHALRGTGEAEKLLKNAKTELWNEHEEIGNYLSIETLATALGDRDTAKLAREFRKQEERMAAFLQKLIPTLTKAVVTEEVPASERRSNGSRSRAKPAKRRATSAKRSASSRAKPAKRSSSSRAKPAKRSSSSRSSTAKRSASSRSSTAKRSASSRAKPAKRASTARAKPAKARAKPAKARAKRRGTTRSS